MVLSGQSIRSRCVELGKPSGRFKPMLSPFNERTREHGMTHGVGPSGYDIRIAESAVLKPGGFALASAMERFDMPRDLLGIVHDKSTWARMGLALQNTVIEAGWRGFLTLELTNHSQYVIRIKTGTPIAQIIFHVLDAPAETPYEGKYMDQKSGPQAAILEEKHALQLA